MCFLCACSSQENAQESPALQESLTAQESVADEKQTPEMTRDAYPMLVLSDVTAEGCTYRLQNPTLYYLGRVSTFTLLQLQDGQWQEVPYLDSTTAIGIQEGVPLAPFENEEQSVDWSDLYGSLTPGQYRMEWELFFEDNPSSAIFLRDSFVIS